MRKKIKLSVTIGCLSVIFFGCDCDEQHELMIQEHEENIKVIQEHNETNQEKLEQNQDSIRLRIWRGSILPATYDREE